MVISTLLFEFWYWFEIYNYYIIFRNVKYLFMCLYISIIVLWCYNKYMYVNLCWSFLMSIWFTLNNFSSSWWELFSMFFIYRHFLDFSSFFDVLCKFLLNNLKKKHNICLLTTMHLLHKITLFCNQDNIGIILI